MKWKLFSFGALALPFLSGCAAVANGLHTAGDLIGADPAKAQAATEAAKSSLELLPFPWNILAVAALSAIGGVAAHQYRRKLLMTDPATVK